MKTTPIPLLTHLNSFYGVTLLAFGNGAPDLFAAISASAGVTGESIDLTNGFYLGAASTLSSALFVSSIVTSCIAIFGKTHE